VDDVLVHKAAVMLAARAGSGAFLGSDPVSLREQEAWMDHACAAVAAVEQVLLSQSSVERAASALGEEALNLMDRDLGTLHAEQLARTAILAALGTDEASTYARRLGSPMSMQAVRCPGGQ
jgi:hypothetical protein